MELIGKPSFKDGRRTQIVRKPTSKQYLRYQSMVKVFDGIKESMTGLHELARHAADDTSLTVSKRRLVIGSAKALVTNLGDFLRRMEKDEEFMEFLNRRETDGRVHREDQP